MIYGIATESSGVAFLSGPKLQRDRASHCAGRQKSHLQQMRHVFLVCATILLLLLLSVWFSLSDSLILPSVLWCCWLGGTTSIQPVKNLSGEVLAWLSVWSKVQHMASWCYCHSVSCFSKIWYQLTRVVPDNGPLNACVCVCVYHWQMCFVCTVHIRWTWQFQFHCNYCSTLMVSLQLGCYFLSSVGFALLSGITVAICSRFILC